MFRGKREHYNFYTAKVRHTFFVFFAVLWGALVGAGASTPARADVFEDVESWTHGVGENIFGFERGACQSVPKSSSKKTNYEKPKAGEQINVPQLLASCLVTPGIAAQTQLLAVGLMATLEGAKLSIGDEPPAEVVQKNAEDEYRWMFRAAEKQQSLLDANDLRMGRLRLERDRSRKNNADCAVGAPYSLDHYCTEKARTLANLRRFLLIEGELKNLRAALAMKWENPEKGYARVSRLEAEWQSLLAQTPLIAHPKLLAYATDLGFGHYDQAIREGFDRDFSAAVDDVAQTITLKTRQVRGLRMAVTQEDRQKYLQDSTLIQELALVNRGQVEIKDPALLASACRLEARVSGQAAVDTLNSLAVNSVLAIMPLGIGALAKATVAARVGTTLMVSLDAVGVARDVRDLGQKANECRNFQAIGLLKDDAHPERAAQARTQARACEKEFDELAAMSAIGSVAMVGGNITQGLGHAEKGVLKVPDRQPARVRNSGVGDEIGTANTAISQSNPVPKNTTPEVYTALSEQQRAEYWLLSQRRTELPKNGLIPGLRLNAAEYQNLRTQVARLSSDNTDSIAKNVGQLIHSEAPLKLLGDGGMGYVFLAKLEGRDVIVKVPKYSKLPGFYDQSLEIVLSAAQKTAQSQAIKSAILSKNGVSTVAHSRVASGEAGQLGIFIADYLPTPEPLKKAKFRTGNFPEAQSRPVALAAEEDKTGALPVGKPAAGDTAPIGAPNATAAAVEEKEGVYSARDYLNYLRTQGESRKAKDILEQVDDLEKDIHFNHDEILLLERQGITPTLEEAQKRNPKWAELWKANYDLGMAPWSMKKYEDTAGLEAARVRPDSGSTRRPFPLADVGNQGVNLLPVERKGLTQAQCKSTVIGGVTHTLRVFDFGICIEFVFADP